MQKQNTQTQTQATLMSNSKSSSLSSSPRTCLCSPTNHPGSFRCSLHRAGSNRFGGGGGGKLSTARTAQFNRLHEYSSKLGLLKAFLMQIIKPSSHDQQRRRNFQPKPTRFCVMMKNNNNGRTSNTSGNQVAVS